MSRYEDKNVTVDRLEGETPGYVRAQSGLGQMLSMIAVTSAILLTIGVGGLLYAAILPHMAAIGFWLYIFFGILLVLACLLAVMFVGTRMGIMWSDMQRARLESGLIQAGNIVAFYTPDGELRHLSAEQIEAGQHSSNTQRQVLQGNSDAPNSDTVMELYGKGASEKTIAESMGYPVYVVKDVIREAKRRK